MTDLTDKWKKGELPIGWYYVEGSRAEGIYAYTAEYLNNMYRPRNGERVIEQVPSYEEWDKLNNACHELEKENACLIVENVNIKKWCEEFNALDVAKENTKLKERLKKTQELELEVRRENAQLKELLKECLEVLKMVAGETIDFPRTVDECIDKINQALGEEK